MKTTPNADNPEADIRFIIEELSDLFGVAEARGESHLHLNSAVGSKFHARVKNAAEHLAKAAAARPADRAQPSPAG